MLRNLLVIVSIFVLLTHVVSCGITPDAEVSDEDVSATEMVEENTSEPDENAETPSKVQKWRQMYPTDAYEEEDYLALLPGQNPDPEFQYPAVTIHLYYLFRADTNKSENLETMIQVLEVHTFDNYLDDTSIVLCAEDLLSLACLPDVDETLAKRLLTATTDLFARCKPIYKKRTYTDVIDCYAIYCVQMNTLANNGLYDSETALKLAEEQTAEICRLAFPDVSNVDSIITNKLQYLHNRIEEYEEEQIYFMRFMLDQL